jgi:hypothetical protein
VGTTLPPSRLASFGGQLGLWRTVRFARKDEIAGFTFEWLLT